MRNSKGESRIGGRSTFRGRRAVRVIGLAVVGLGGARAVEANDLTWVGANTSQVWSTTASNWSVSGASSVWTNGNTDVATFNGTAIKSTVNATGSPKFDAMSFEALPLDYSITGTLTAVSGGNITLQASAGSGASGNGAVEMVSANLNVNGNSFAFDNGDLDTNSALDYSGTLAANTTGTTLTLGGNGGGTNLISGTLANNSNGTGGLGVVISGTSPWEFSGTNTYLGGTSVTSSLSSSTTPATLILSGTGNNVLGGTSVTIGNSGGNGTLKIVGNVGLGTTSAGTLSLAGGNGSTVGQGVLDMRDGTTNTFTLNNATSGATVMTIGSASAAAALYFDVGSASADEISMMGSLSIGAGGGIVNLNVLSAPTGTSPYTLISSTGGITGAGSLVFSNMGVTSTSETINGETYTLIATGNAEELGFAPATSTPEPTTAGIVVFGAGIAMLKRRRNSIEQTTSRTV